MAFYRPRDFLDEDASGALMNLATSFLLAPVCIFILFWLSGPQRSPIGSCMEMGRCSDPIKTLVATIDGAVVMFRAKH